MQEAFARLRFTRPALGYAQRRTRSQNVIYVMPRDPAKNIMFLASWWRERMEYAAKVLNRYHDLAGRIAWDQAVQGRVSQYCRPVMRKKDGSMVKSGYARHEAFQVGEEITVSAVLPDNLSLEAFRELLDIVGRYKGMSPYNSETDVYGTFEVLSIQPVVRQPPEQVEEIACRSSFAAPVP
jgi:hypothetical protein